MPAAGYRNGSSLNNAGENGNYWSSTPNESNDNNAYNLNFNSSNHNVNWNNRNNGQSVRPVSEFIMISAMHHFRISKSQLLLDLYKAYKDARLNKRSKDYQLKFEYSLERNLVSLRDDIYYMRYKPLPSTCFVIRDPKTREVFAANFRDRIVHHLFYNYTAELFQRTFIYDSYSCIKNKGTHFGIQRLKKHIIRESNGFSRKCYVLKVDFRGYFMSMNRNLLLDICRDTLNKMRYHKLCKGGPSWQELIDFELIDYLLESIVQINPLDFCNMLGSRDDWKDLPKEKSLYFSKNGCGLPIGNLSSQLFSNVYLNVYDQYVKRVLKCKSYGRYVDDSYIVSGDKDYLKSLIPLISEFVGRNLGLQLHTHKTKIYDAELGVEFLGAYIKPFRTYVSSSSLSRIKKKLTSAKYNGLKHMQCSVNSYLGVFSHYDSYILRKKLFAFNKPYLQYGTFDRDCLVFRPYHQK